MSNERYAQRIETNETKTNQVTTIQASKQASKQTNQRHQSNRPKVKMQHLAKEMEPSWRDGMERKEQVPSEN